MSTVIEPVLTSQMRVDVVQTMQEDVRKLEKCHEVDWHYSGRPNFFWGTAATTVERAVGNSASVAVPVALYALSWRSLDWTIFGYVIAAVVAADIGGGVVANALNSCKRFYHGSSSDESAKIRLAKAHWVFVAVHLHPFLVGLVFGTDRTSALNFGTVWYGAIWLAYAILQFTPLYLKRPVAFGLIVVGIIVNLYALLPPHGFEWFAPLFLLKIVYGHLVPEEPYRPVVRRT